MGASQRMAVSPGAAGWIHAYSLWPIGASLVALLCQFPCRLGRWSSQSFLAWRNRAYSCIAAPLVCLSLRQRMPISRCHPFASHFTLRFLYVHALCLPAYHWATHAATKTLDRVDLGLRGRARAGLRPRRARGFAAATDRARGRCRHVPGCQRSHHSRPQRLGDLDLGHVNVRLGAPLPSTLASIPSTVMGCT